MKMELVLRLANQNSFPGESDARVGGVGNVRQEYAFPDGRSLRSMHILNVEDDLGKSFVEDAGLHLERHLRTFELVLKARQCGLRFRRKVKAINQREQPRGHNKNREHAQE